MLIKKLKKKKQKKHLGLLNTYSLTQIQLHSHMKITPTSDEVLIARQPASDAA